MIRLLKAIFSWKETRRLRQQAYNEICRAEIHGLPATMTKDEWVDIVGYFKHKCPLTGATENLSLEHFIPISWGYGGTTVGNCYPLQADMNMRKSDKNPFEWIKTEKNVNISAWNYLIAYLATQNNKTVGEFTNYVNECYRYRKNQ